MLKIKKNGIIQDGEFYWNYDERDYGLMLRSSRNEQEKAIRFCGWVKVKMGWLPAKKYEFNDKYNVARERLLSANVKQGQVIDLNGKGAIEILTCSETTATARLSSAQYNGTVGLDLTQELLDVTYLNARVTYAGTDVTIQAERV